MNLSQGEKLILMALAAAKDGKEELDLDFIRRAILSGNTWALTWELSGIPAEDTDPKVAEETASILSMWSVIEGAINRLPSGDQEKLKKESYPHSLEFDGFDGNNDKHHGVARFIVDDLDRFSEFKGRSLNSHSQSSLPWYRKMLVVYDEEIKSTGYGSRSLSVDSLLKIVKGGLD